MEKEFSAEQSLALIEGMINKAKNNYSDDSALYIVWGWVVFICSAGHFMLIKFTSIKRPEYIWMLMFLAVIFQIIFLAKRKKKENIKTYTDEILSYVWISFAVSMCIISVFSGAGKGWIEMYPVLLMLYGTPIFLSGIILRFLPLKIGGIACWCLAVIAQFTESIYLLLLVALAMIAGWIIPGYLLKIKFKKQNHG